MLTEKRNLTARNDRVHRGSLATTGDDWWTTGGAFRTEIERLSWEGVRISGMGGAALHVGPGKANSWFARRRLRRETIGIDVGRAMLEPPTEQKAACQQGDLILYGV